MTLLGRYHEEEDHRASAAREREKADDYWRLYDKIADQAPADSLPYEIHEAVRRINEWPKQLTIDTGHSNETLNTPNKRSTT